LICPPVKTDTCYVLSFSVIILNTSLHNPSVKEKPTLDKFIAMNRGINDGKDIPRDIQEVPLSFSFPPNVSSFLFGDTPSKLTDSFPNFISPEYLR